MNDTLNPNSQGDVDQIFVQPNGDIQYAPVDPEQMARRADAEEQQKLESLGGAVINRETSFTPEQLKSLSIANSGVEIMAYRDKVIKSRSN